MFLIIILVSFLTLTHEQPPDSPVSIIAQSLSDNKVDEELSSMNQSENANSSVVPPVGSLEKYHNATEPSYLYVVQLELKSSRVDESFGELEKRLDKMVGMAFALASYKHRKQTAPAELTTSNSGYTTKIIKKRVSGDVTHIHFVTYAGNELVLGEVVADDLTLLSVSQISATLRYALGKIISDRDIQAESSTKWIFLIGIIGAGVFIVLIGWCCLFLFFNFCDFDYGTGDGDYWKITPRAVPFKKREPRDVLPFGGITSATKNDSNLKEDKPHTNRVTLLLEEALEHKRQKIDKALMQAFWESAWDVKFSKTPVPPPPSDAPKIGDTENKDVETAQPDAVVVAKSEKKRRHTKIGPITAVTTTTTTTNEQEGKTSEISGVGSVTTTSTNELDGFDVSNLPETSLKISKKKKFETDPEVRSEPESDYGSSLEDEKSKDDEEIEKEIHEDVVRVRPMTAKKQRTSLFGASLLSSIPPQPRAWTVYQAGDRVSEFWNNSRMNSYPTPASPTEDGMIQLRTSNSFNF